MKQKVVQNVFSLGLHNMIKKTQKSIVVLAFKGLGLATGL